MVLPRPLSRHYSSTSWPVPAASLDGVEKRERLDVVGGGHDGLDLTADNLHKVLELHLCGSTGSTAGISICSGLCQLEAPS